MNAKHTTGKKLCKSSSVSSLLPSSRIIRILGVARAASILFDHNTITHCSSRFSKTH